MEEVVRQFKRYSQPGTARPSYNKPDPDQDIVQEMPWLEQPEHEPGVGDVTDEVKRILDETIELFDHEMRAEGRPRWREEMIERTFPEMKFTEVSIPDPEEPVVSRVCLS